MKNQNKGVIQKISLFTGAVLIVVAIIILVFWQCNIHFSVQRAEKYVQTILSSISMPQGAALEERKDNTMPILSVDTADFVGILEMPRYKSALPVCADWGSVTKYPCRFDGSIYNRTMQIGATTQKGQYDFYREICVGDTVIFTDMEGNRYTYSITNLKYEKSAEKTVLEQEESALTLFIKNVYDFEYLIISCDVNS